MYPNIDKLLGKVDSRFTLAILAAKRARQINDYLNSIQRHELTEVRGPELDVISEKPLTIAFDEIARDKIGYERLAEGIK
ncbi:MAG: DNA-directed RNA polymerase subunit omega [Actinomycetota bacterium]|nr:DNA-directed RNA polymerase subunit omega [Actinomycetota bacterium]